MPPTYPKPVLTTSSSSRAATIRRLRSRRRKDENIEVDLSPLIDCVFLLLIFFLVTTMLKKLEKQIPVVLPDYTSALASIAESEAIIYALEADGSFLRGDGLRRNRDGIAYSPIASFVADLKTVADTHGTEIAIRLDTDREVPVQLVIDALDTLALQGFEQVGVRLRHLTSEDFALEGYR
ncbi:biopolymer transporter ExbD [Coraliomargarita algicola]|uniref:Biopolymer transporter ExbD n=1 Tax=Coraliomargarita algicola TaxID=3092156 RepID=A0ABZ0RL91_9BACT|nr:biopolymer transporter ExbD [Coraliomargarita sp. J2-16]WPJ95858.1 biopolymer transporter ExbD [Coraliomargarita sp. J2-16]